LSDYNIHQYSLEHQHLYVYGCLEMALGVAVYLIMQSYNMPGNYALAAGFAFVAWGGYRVGQGIGRSQDLKGLGNSEYFKTTMQEIRDRLRRVSKKLIKDGKDPYLYFGRGFLWKAKHAQLFEQIKSIPDREKYFNEVTQGGGAPFIHNLGAKEEEDMHLQFAEHTFIAGLTGIGKTRLMELYCGQLLDQGNCIVIVDPKGDSGLLNCIYQACTDCGRRGDFHFISLAHPQQSSSIDLIANFLNPGDAAGRIASIMPNTGNSAPFIAFCHEVMTIELKVMDIVGIPVNLKNLKQYVARDMDALERAANNYLVGEEVTDDERILLEDTLQDLHKKVESDKKHFDKMTTSLLPVLTSLTDGELGALLSPKKADLTWESIIDKRKVVYLSLSSMIDSFAASNVGKLFVQDLICHVGMKYSRELGEIPDLHLVVDEFNSVIFEGYIDILNKARAAGVHVTLTTQTAADISAVLDRDRLDQIWTNVTNKIIMRVPNKNMAEEISSLFGEVKIPKWVHTRGVNANLGGATEVYKSSHSVRLDQEAVPLLAPDILKTLPKGHAIISQNGLPPRKVRFPLLDRGDRPEVDFFRMLNDVPKVIPEGGQAEWTSALAQWEENSRESHGQDLM